MAMKESKPKPRTVVADTAVFVDADVAATFHPFTGERTQERRSTAVEHWQSLDPSPRPVAILRKPKAALLGVRPQWARISYKMLCSGGASRCER